MSDPIQVSAAPTDTGTTAAPAAAAAPAQNGTVATQAVAAPPDWLSGLSDDAKGYVQNKGFKDPAAAIDSYRNLEKLMGVPKERLLKLPEKDDDPAWAEIHTRLGKPASADEYKIDGENKDFAKWAKGTFHELGLSKKQAETLFGKYNDYAKGLGEKQSQAMAERLQQSEAGLKKEWGAAFDQNLMTAKKAAMAFGLDAATIDKLESAMGYDGVMKFMHSVGSKVGEDSFVSSGQSARGFGAMTPEQARNRIASLKQDKEFAAKLSNGNAEARNEWDRLNQWAMPS